jgi:uncharacterized protein
LPYTLSEQNALDTMKIERTEHTVPLPNLADALDGLRVAHLTDFHRCHLTRDSLLREAVARANAACPDLIVLTGDYVYFDPADIAPCADILSELKAPLGVYAILGNHDYSTDGPAMYRALENIGVTMLHNASVQLPGGLWIAGIDDDIKGKPDVSAAFAPIPPDEPTLALIHNPRTAKRFAQRRCLALSGHTHGGQVVLPFVTARKLRQIGAEHFRAGWYTVGNVRLYVNRGLGNAGVPFRLFSPPEIALFSLEPSPA